MEHSKSLSSPETVKHFSELGSTNATAKRLLEEGISPPFWVLADAQNEGRGRQGRSWVSLRGNLFTSAVKSLKTPAPRLASLSLVAGLAVVNAIKHNQTTPTDLTLKWPNDILVNGAKLGGVLIEAQPSSNTAQTDVIIGIGLNISERPDLPERQTISLRDTGLSISRDDFFASLRTALAEGLNLWQEGENLKEIINRWQIHAAPIGTKMTVKAGQEEVSGQFAGLDETGALCLELENSTIKTITAGELL